MYFELYFIKHSGEIEPVILDIQSKVTQKIPISLNGVYEYDIDDVLIIKNTDTLLEITTYIKDEFDTIYTIEEPNTKDEDKWLTVIKQIIKSFESNITNTNKNWDIYIYDENGNDITLETKKKYLVKYL
jgi:hypothetical protein